MSTPLLTDAPESPEEAVAFARWAQGVNLRAIPIVGLGLAACALLWWPADLVLYAGRPGAQHEFAFMRTAVIFTLGLAGLFGPRVAALRARPTATAFVTSIVLNTLLGWGMAGAGTPDGPWLTYLCIVPGMPAFVLAPLRARILGTSAVSIAAVGAYLVRRPDAVHELLFGAAVSHLVFSTILAASVGHIFYAVVRSSFLNRARLERLTESLEDRLAERTAQIRRIGQHAEAVREEERRRIATDLHDELGQELTALRYAVAFARRQGGVGALGEVDARIDRTHETVRHLLAGMRPRVLDELGVEPALATLCAETARRSGVEVTFTGAAGAVGPDVSVAAFRMVQEALNNTLKHARAKRVEVGIRRDRDGLSLTVADDGIGIDADASDRGLGLLGIRERARALGGDATWDGTHGTRLRVHLPLPSEIAP